MSDSLAATIKRVKEKLTKEAVSSLLDEALLVSKLLGPKSEFGNISKEIATLSKDEKQQIGTLLNECKREVLQAIQKRTTKNTEKEEWFDVSTPGQRPPIGHLHIVTQAITDITRIFERIGFTRVRHPEIDTDWYAFESLNMPPDHPARDEWETFFIQSPITNNQSPTKRKIVLTPHTSNGQVREMEKGNLPIRMINIAKCYRRQSDISHVPMFHQFEGMYIDKNVSIGHLKGFIDYFVKQYFGPERKSRLRPFHFQFTEPSFEVDITCGICNGTSILPNGGDCKLCKGGWLELAGSGMIHPNVLKNGGVDPSKYSGFAIGWGVERTAMMKSGTKLDDIRLLYSNDLQFLEQF
ncbi:phenylalanine--tRNA ligase subunit alpha [Candidatus Gottesmanbacteria bacterium]|nr:phenylalanine--tRNA ligase subunit alpha [Candidatus Gottesmanbacteria bacterium]